MCAKVVGKKRVVRIQDVARIVVAAVEVLVHLRAVEAQVMEQVGVEVVQCPLLYQVFCLLELLH